MEKKKTVRQRIDRASRNTEHVYVQNLSVENGVDSDSSNKFIEFSLSQPVEDLEVYVKAVSYTHLTLPTKA